MHTQQSLIQVSTPFGRKKGSKADFTFIDLFAGIGGTRLGFEAAGGKCVFTSEWDTASQKTYLANFGEMPDMSFEIGRAHV